MRQTVEGARLGVGIVACVQGDSARGGKMIGFGVLFAFLWNIARVALEAMSQ